MRNDPSADPPIPSGKSAQFCDGWQAHAAGEAFDEARFVDWRLGWQGRRDAIAPSHDSKKENS